mgnify:CR=1 FL=1
MSPEETKIFSMQDGYDKPERLLPAKGFKLSMTSVRLYYELTKMIFACKSELTKLIFACKSILRAQ